MKFYKNLSLKSKFLSLVIGFFIAFVIFLVLTILGETKSSKATQEQIVAMLQQEIEAKIKLGTDSMASALGEIVKGLSEKEQIQIISKAISKMYFEDDKSSYYFVYKEGVALAYPHQTDIIGKSLWDTKDINGTYFIRDLFESAKGVNLSIMFSLSPCQMENLLMHKKYLMHSLSPTPQIFGLARVCISTR